jgi:hypothetical protein
MRRTRSRRRGSLAAVAAAVAVLIAGSGCGDLSRGELQRGVESLSALAAQGRLLGDGVARDRTKLTYTRVMSRTLGEQAQHEAEKLQDADVQFGLDERRDRAVTLAGDIAEEYSRLQTFPADETIGRHVRDSMLALQRHADALADELGTPE